MEVYLLLGVMVFLLVCAGLRWMAHRRVLGPYVLFTVAAGLCLTLYPWFAIGAEWFVGACLLLGVILAASVPGRVTSAPPANDFGFRRWY